MSGVELTVMVELGLIVVFILYFLIKVVINSYLKFKYDRCSICESRDMFVHGDTYRTIRCSKCGNIEKKLI